MVSRQKHAYLQAFHPSLPVLSASPNESQPPGDAQIENQSGTMSFHPIYSFVPSVADDTFPEKDKIYYVRYPHPTHVNARMFDQNLSISPYSPKYLGLDSPNNSVELHNVHEHA